MHDILVIRECLGFFKSSKLESQELVLIWVSFSMTSLHILIGQPHRFLWTHNFTETDKSAREGLWWGERTYIFCLSGYVL